MIMSSPPTRLSQGVDILGHSMSVPRICDNILSRLYPTQLTRLSHINHVAYDTVQKFRTNDINHRLTRFFEDPLSFRSLMAQTHTVISGSFALQFMDGSYYPNSDLDLYILPNDTLLILGAYLLHQGYIYTPQEWQLEDFLEDAQHILATLDVIPDIEDNNKPDYRSKFIRTVYTFQHHVTDEDVRSVQVVIPRVSPLSCILAFHSSELITSGSTTFDTDIAFNSLCHEYRHLQRRFLALSLRHVQP